MPLAKTVCFALIASLCAAALSSCHRMARRPEGAAAAKAKVIPPTQRGKGDITGQVNFAGAPPKRIQVSMQSDAMCAEMHPAPVYLEDYEVNPDGSLPNAFVYVMSGLAARPFPAPKQPVVLTQEGCIFRPHVLGVIAGQPVEIVSKDMTTHNVDFVPRKNRHWDHTLPPGASPLYVRFSKPEIMIPVTCNEHRWMYAYVGVTTNPFFAVTGNDGRFTIQGLPPGDYVLGVWTATFGTQEQRVAVRGNETTAVYFVFKSQ